MINKMMKSIGSFLATMSIPLVGAFAGTTLLTNGDFENGLTGWTVVSGNLQTQPTTGRTEVEFNKSLNHFIGTTEINGGTKLIDFNDGLTGTIQSDSFVINSNNFGYRIGGGNGAADRYVALVVGSNEVIKDTGSNNEGMVLKSHDVSSYIGQTAFIRIVDNATGGWGHINADQFFFSDNPIVTDISLLDTQIGFQTEAIKKIYLRSDTQTPSVSPTGKTFHVYDSNNQSVYNSTITYWGEKWEDHWWILDFSSVKTNGTYHVSIPDLAPLTSEWFTISATPLIDETLVKVGITQLEDRVQTPIGPQSGNWQGFNNYPGDTQDQIYKITGQPDTRWGWPDCDSDIRELSSHIITVHALADVYENVYDHLTSTEQTRLLTQLRRGADYLVYSKESDNRFNHDKAYYTNYATSDYYNWNDMAYGITGLVRAYNVFKTSDPGLAQTYLDAAEAVHAHARSRKYHLASEFAGPGGAQGNLVHNLGRIFYDKPSGWTVPTTLRTKAKINYLWATTLLMEVKPSTTVYQTEAIATASAIAERQFVDHLNPIEGVYGNFFEFEGDDVTFMPEYAHNHRWHMGNISPTNLIGFIELLKKFPNHADAAKWYGVLKNYDHYVKQSANLSPFKIAPVTTYSPNTVNSAYSGVKYFKNILHGATTLYGQIAKNYLEVGNYFNDNEYHELASQNVQFVVGLNSGIPTGYNAKSWVAKSLLKGIGKKSFPGSGGVNGHAPDGSGLNGFVFLTQFGQHAISAGPDAPKGIWHSNGSLQFNESYLPHSHGYISGIASLENEFTLKVNATSAGIPVSADINVNLNAGFSALHVTDGGTGSVTVTNLPLQRSGTLTATYNGVTLSRSIETLGNGQLTWAIDFAEHASVAMNVPATLQAGASGTGSISITNQGSASVSLTINLSTYGVTTTTGTFTLNAAPGATASQTFNVTGGNKVMPYFVRAHVAGTNFSTTAVAEGKQVASGFQSNLTGWTVHSGTWTDVNGGKQGVNAVGDGAYMASESGTDFTYEADIKVTTNNPSAGALLFRANSNPFTGSYVVNVQTSGVVRFFKFPYTPIQDYSTTINANQTYHVKVVTSGSNIKVYLDNGATPVIDVNDTTYTSGRFGLMTWDGTAVYQNVNRN